jgi:hypothetical protein
MRSYKCQEGASDELVETTSLLDGIPLLGRIRYGIQPRSRIQSDMASVHTAGMYAGATTAVGHGNRRSGN